MKVSTDSNTLETTVDVLSEKQSRIRKFIQRYKDAEKCRIKALIQRYKSVEQSIKQRETRLERRDEPLKKIESDCQKIRKIANESLRSNDIDVPDIMRGGRGIDYRNKHNGRHQYR